MKFIIYSVIGFASYYLVMFTIAYFFLKKHWFQHSVAHLLELIHELKGEHK